MTLTDTTSGDNDTKTVQAAVEFLHNLRPRILGRLSGEDLRVGLNRMDVMRPERGDLTRAHVMWAGPSYENEHAKQLKRVCGTCTFAIHASEPSAADAL